MAFEELKQRQIGDVGNGPYQNVTETLVDIHQLVIERLDPQPGDRWLDLACGTGAVAELAARAGATVMGIDLAPVLIETARERAQEAGLEIDYRVGRLRAPGSRRRFDQQGVVDLRDHVRTGPRADGARARSRRRARRSDRSRELDPGGRPRSDVPDDAAVPAGSAARCGESVRLGRDEHVRELLGDSFELEIDDRVSTVRVSTGEDYWQLFSSSYGPTKSAAEALEDGRREEFHQTWVDFFETRYRSDEEIVHEREYLLVLGTRRA